MSKLREWAKELVIQEALGIKSKKFLVYSRSLHKEMDADQGGETYIKALHRDHALLIMEKEMRKDSILVFSNHHLFGEGWYENH